MSEHYAIRFIGAEAVRERLAKVRSACKDMKPAFARAVAVVDRWIQMNFKDQGSPVGGWAPLKDSTIKRRRNKDKGAIKILQDNGTLKMRWKHIINDDSAAVVSGVDYGIYHETGTKKMVQRRILPTQEEMWPKLKPLFEGHVERSFHD